MKETKKGNPLTVGYVGIIRWIADSTEMPVLCAVETDVTLCFFGNSRSIFKELLNPCWKIFKFQGYDLDKLLLNEGEFVATLKRNPGNLKIPCLKSDNVIIYKTADSLMENLRSCWNNEISELEYYDTLKVQLKYKMQKHSKKLQKSEDCKQYRSSTAGLFSGIRSFSSVNCLSVTRLVFLILKIDQHTSIIILTWCLQKPG